MEKRKPRAERVEKEQALKARTLLCEGTGGEFKVDLPPGARVTFGPNTPGPTRGQFVEPGTRGYALRVYADKTNSSLIAVFADVRGFRDITIPTWKLVVRESGKSMWKSDEEGYEVSENVKRETTLVDANRLLGGGHK